jgi:hypothetical protein
MKRPLIGRKDFKTSIGQGEQAQGGVMGGLQRKILCVLGEEKEEDECVRKKIVVMCEKNIVHEKTKCVQTKGMGGSCV